jgi:hypothetical protein
MRRPTYRLSLVAVALAASFLPAGCSGGHSWGGGSEGDHGSKEGVRFDYDITSLTCDGRTFLVLAVDGRSGGGMIISEKTQGTFCAVDGRNVPWSCTTRDGVAGTVAIAGQQFELAKGAVFLISLKAGQTKVEQLSVDMSKLQGGKMEDKLNAVGETEPRIKVFLKECRGEKRDRASHATRCERPACRHACDPSGRPIVQSIWWPVRWSARLWLGSAPHR